MPGLANMSKLMPLQSWLIIWASDCIFIIPDITDLGLGGVEEDSVPSFKELTVQRRRQASKRQWFSSVIKSHDCCKQRGDGNITRGTSFSPGEGAKEGFPEEWMPNWEWKTQKELGKRGSLWQKEEEEERREVTEKK